MKPTLAILALLTLIVSAAAAAPDSLRVAQFNIWELSTTKILDLDEDGAGRHPQLLAAAAIIREVSPDILLINEIDHDYEALARGADLALNARRFIDHYLNRGEGALDYPHVYAAPCNTGILSGMDLDNDGVVAGEAQRGSREHGGDCYGYGIYPGQYSMAVLSRYPLLAEEARGFQSLRWIDLPGAMIPEGWYSEQELAAFRLSSKSHWDLPVLVGERRLHLLASHPTPTDYDGPEDRNGLRNHDEIALWARYLDGDDTLVDDAGRLGGLAPGESFVLLGDLNADPGRDVLPSGERSIDQLLTHPRVLPTGHLLTSAGALRGRPAGPPDHVERHTVGWEGGGLRIDYLLPSVDLKPIAGGVHWPDADADPAGAARAERASDHRMIWLDIALD